MGPEVSDVDGNTEDRRGTISVFNGQSPIVTSFDTEKNEAAAVSDWLKDRTAEGYMAHELGVFVRSDAELARAVNAVSASGLPHTLLNDEVESIAGHVSVGTMHLAKGLEFRGVAVMACDDEVIPLQSRIDNVGDEADLEEIYNTERYLLYVAYARARDNLLVTATKPESEFLADLTCSLISAKTNMSYCIAPEWALTSRATSGFLFSSNQHHNFVSKFSA